MSVLTAVMRPRWEALDDDALDNDNDDWLPLEDEDSIDWFDNRFNEENPLADERSKACAHYVRTPNALTIIGTFSLPQTLLVQPPPPHPVSCHRQQALPQHAAHRVRTAPPHRPPYGDNLDSILKT